MNDLDGFPELRTSRLTLTALLNEHAQGMFDLFTDARVTEFYTVMPLTDKQDMIRVIDMFAEQYRMKKMIRWAIIESDGQQLIGTIGLHQVIPTHKASVVFALSPPYQGRGYAAEALGAVVKYCFEQQGLARIQAEVMPGNNASDHLLLRAGFMHEGLLRQWMQWNGKSYDMNMYAMVQAAK